MYQTTHVVNGERKPCDGLRTRRIMIAELRLELLRPGFSRRHDGSAMRQFIDPLRQIIADLGQPGHQLATKVGFD